MNRPFNMYGNDTYSKTCTTSPLLRYGKQRIFLNQKGVRTIAD